MAGPWPGSLSLPRGRVMCWPCNREQRKAPGILLNWGRRCYKAPRKSAPASTPDIPSVLFRPRRDAGYIGALKIIAGPGLGFRGDPGPQQECRWPEFCPLLQWNRRFLYSRQRWQLQNTESLWSMILRNNRHDRFVCSPKSNPNEISGRVRPIGIFVVFKRVNKIDPWVL